MEEMETRNTVVDRHRHSSSTALLHPKTSRRGGNPEEGLGGRGGLSWPSVY